MMPVFSQQSCGFSGSYIFMVKGFCAGTSEIVSYDAGHKNVLVHIFIFHPYLGNQTVLFDRHVLEKGNHTSKLMTS